MHFKQNQKMLQLQAKTACSYIYYFLQSRRQVQKERVYTGGRPPLESTLVLWDDDVVRHSFLSLLYYNGASTVRRRVGDVSKNYLSSLPLLPGYEYVRAWGGGGGSSLDHSRAQELRMARTSLAHICMRQWHQALLITVLHSHLYAAFFAQLGSCDL